MDDSWIDDINMGTDLPPHYSPSPQMPRFAPPPSIPITAEKDLQKQREEAEETIRKLEAELKTEREHAEELKKMLKSAGLSGTQPQSQGESSQFGSSIKRIFQGIERIKRTASAVIGGEESVDESRKRVKVDKKVIAAFSGFGKGGSSTSENDVQELKESIIALGGEVRLATEDVLPLDVTHLIVCPNVRSYRSMAYALLGKWLVVRQWVEQSKKQGYWADEAKFGRFEHSSFKNKTFQISPEYVAEQSSRVNCVANTKSLISLGGGKVVDSDDADYVLVAGHGDGKNISWNDFCHMIPGTGLIRPARARSESPAFPI